MSEPSPESQPRQLLGHMYLSSRPCGKVVAMVWDTPNSEKSTQRCIERWKRMGETVTRVPFYQGDEAPRPACRPSASCSCAMAREKPRPRLYPNAGLAAA